MLEEFTHVASLTVPARTSSRERIAENVSADALRRNGEASACRGGALEMSGDVCGGRYIVELAMEIGIITCVDS